MRRPTILIVDSYHGSRRALGDLLRESGYPVFEAPNGVDGLRLAREIVPALVLVALWPFFSSSVQMVERLRESPRTERTDVLVLTSAVSTQHRNRALAAGCAGFLEKPCDADGVLAEVRRITGPKVGGEKTAPRSPRPGAAPLAMPLASSMRRAADSQYRGVVDAR